MHCYQPVPIEFFEKNPFELIGKDWMLITAAKGDEVNTMTASWGGLGVIWGKNAAYITVRHSRYTKEFLDSADTFSLSFFGENFKMALKYLGAVSGRDEDKIANARLDVNYHEPDHTPFIDEANMVLICRKMYAEELSPEGFCVPEIEENWYKDGDYHVLYIGEVVEILAR